MDLQKVLNIILIIIVIYFIYRDFLNEPKTENFENITLGSADDQNAINKLAQIASQLMAGGLTVPGDMTINNTLKAGNTTLGTLNVGALKATDTTLGTLNAGNTTIPVLYLGSKFRLSGVGDAQANDEWLRIFKTDGSTNYAGGLAVGKLWTADNTINGRNLFAEIDEIKKNFIRKEEVVRLRRTLSDGNEGAYFKGDGWVPPGDGWSTWRIFKA